MSPDETAAALRLMKAAPKLLEACKEQHQAIDWLLARCIESIPGFLPTRTPVWGLIVNGSAAIAEAEGSAE